MPARQALLRLLPVPVFLQPGGERGPVAQQRFMGDLDLAPLVSRHEPALPELVEQPGGALLVASRKLGEQRLAAHLAPGILGFRVHPDHVP